VRDEEQRHKDGHNEVGSTQLTRLEPNPIALIEGVKQIRGAPQVEHPGERQSQPPRQRRQSQQGEDRRNEIAVRGGARKSSRQVRRDDAGHQKCQADEPETVQEDQRPQCVGKRLAGEPRPDVPRRDKPPGDEAEGDTGSVQG
jgi:hypothetical protein